MAQKYELIEHGIEYYRIKALIDIPRHNVKAGDLGGLVNTEYNLLQEGDCWIEKECLVNEYSRVEGNALVSGRSNIKSDALISGNSIVNSCIVTGDAVVNGNAVVTDCVVYGSSIIGDDTRVQNMAFVDCILKGQTHIYLPGNWPHTVYNIEGEFTEKDFFVQGPALSSNRHSLGYRQKDGLVKITTGCFEGTLGQYLVAIEKTHKGRPKYLQQYREFHANFVKHFSQ